MLGQHRGGMSTRIQLGLVYALAAYIVWSSTLAEATTELLALR